MSTATAGRSTALCEALRTALRTEQRLLSVEQIDLIITCRELARRNLADFLLYRFAAEDRFLAWNWHLDLLCEALELQERRELLNLIINIPPGFLKSELTSQTWQAWMIGRNETDDSSMLSASNSADLAQRDSEATKTILQADWFADLFPRFGVDPRTGQPGKWRRDRMERWFTPRGAKRESVGAGAKTTGLGAKRLLCDDLMAAGDAASETVREGLLEWWGRTFVNRLRDQVQGTKTVIMQRLHERDLTGRLEQDMQEQGGEQWEIIRLPLECKARRFYVIGDFLYERQKGELLFPAFLPASKVAELKVAMRMDFEGQYNQNPVIEAGNFFKPDFIVQDTATAKEVATRYRIRPQGYLDLASKERQVVSDDPDESVAAIMGRDTYQRVWILDMWGDAVGPEDLAQMIIELDKKWGGIWWKGEKGAIKNMLEPIMGYMGKLRNRRIHIDGLTAAADKVTRAMPLRNLCNTGQIYVPADAPWLATLKRWWRGFPLAAHDDWVDAPAYGAADLEGWLTPSQGDAPTVPIEGQVVKITGRDLAREAEQQQRQRRPAGRRRRR